MSKIVCPTCGTKQSKRRFCISCGEELCLPRDEEQRILDAQFSFTPTKFTKAVKLAAPIIAAAELALTVFLCVRETHSAALPFIATVMSIFAALCLLFPKAAPTLMAVTFFAVVASSRSHHYRVNRDADDILEREDITDGPQKQIEQIYIFFAVLLVISIILCAIFLYTPDRFLIRTAGETALYGTVSK